MRSYPKRVRALVSFPLLWKYKYNLIGEIGVFHGRLVIYWVLLTTKVFVLRNFRINHQVIVYCSAIYSHLHQIQNRTDCKILLVVKREFQCVRFNIHIGQRKRLHQLPGSWGLDYLQLNAKVIVMERKGHRTVTGSFPSCHHFFGGSLGSQSELVCNPQLLL